MFCFFSVTIKIGWHESGIFVHFCTHAQTHTLTHTYKHILEYKHTHTHAQIWWHFYLYTPTTVHTPAFRGQHTHTHTHTHTRTHCDCVWHNRVMPRSISMRVGFFLNFFCRSLYSCCYKMYTRGGLWDEEQQGRRAVFYWVISSQPGPGWGAVVGTAREGGAWRRNLPDRCPGGALKSSRSVGVGVKSQKMSMSNMIGLTQPSFKHPVITDRH